MANFRLGRLASSTANNDVAIDDILTSVIGIVSAVGLPPEVPAQGRSPLRSGHCLGNRQETLCSLWLCGEFFTLESLTIDENAQLCSAPTLLSLKAPGPRGLSKRPLPTGVHLRGGSMSSLAGL
jgi:hypothetical protein